MNPLKRILSDKTSLCKTRTKVCPMCGNEYTGYPAISRDDNVTEICPDCGTFEAVRDWKRAMKKK